jgi:hypothetical protein
MSLVSALGIKVGNYVSFISSDILVDRESIDISISILVDSDGRWKRRQTDSRYEMWLLLIH